MPQLMPLPWVISFLMISFFIILAMFIYSNLSLKPNFKTDCKSSFSILWLW